MIPYLFRPDSESHLFCSSSDLHLVTIAKVVLSLDRSILILLLFFIKFSSSRRGTKSLSTYCLCHAPNRERNRRRAFGNGSHNAQGSKLTKSSVHKIPKSAWVTSGLATKLNPKMPSRLARHSPGLPTRRISLPEMVDKETVR
ncbi:hypothetical protein SLEP1_g3033 [Rubroshorea leprosula]|uniref:Uncharacterized protein n=1 Tax=Rubroshorea leprosula TaxID=152421 RepID=A0AAV5HPV2_9ROSI|nr:hypothetical protein SLEP1_g3033 [Rubroshorea leprosula]